MKVEVDPDLCISCGLCVSSVPEVFSWNEEEKAEAIAEDVASDLEEETREAVDSCPTEAIKKVVTAKG